MVMRDRGGRLNRMKERMRERGRIEGGRRRREGMVEIGGERSMDGHRTHFCLLVSSQALDTHYSA